MGFITDLVKRDDSLKGGSQPLPGQAAWRTIFGATDKETATAFADNPNRATPGGSWGRSVVGSDAATKRLLEAMRSMAPGSWSDDRYEQTMRHYKGVPYLCISRTNEIMSEAEFQVFEKDDNHPDGKRPVRRSHSGYGLVKLLEKPNREDDFGDLMANWNLQMDLTGTALTWMVPNMTGSLSDLYSIPTASAIPQAVINPDYPDGFYRIQPIYPYGPFSSSPTPATAVGAPIGGQWIVRFKYPHPLLRYDGYSPMTAMAEHIDCVQMMDKARHYMMRRGINPSAVLNFDETEGVQPLPEPEIERIRADFENESYGPENVGKLLVSTPGARLDPWGAFPKDMEYQAGWEQLVSFVMAAYGITKPVAGMINDSSYAVLFASLKQFHLLSLNPKCSRISSKLTRFVAPFYGDDLIIEIKCKRIDDHEVNFDKAGILLSTKAGTKNEVRKLLDLPVTRLPWGEEIAGTEPMYLMGAPGVMMEAPPGTPPEMLINPMPPGVNQSPMGQNGAPPGPGVQESMLGLNDTPEPPEVGEQPDPDGMNDESLGPRKNLELFENVVTDAELKELLAKRNGFMEHRKKSFYDRVRGELISNGHG